MTRTRISRKKKKRIKNAFGSSFFYKWKKDQNKPIKYLYSFGVYDPKKSLAWEETLVISSDEVSSAKPNRFLNMSKEELIVFRHFSKKHALLGRQLLNIKKEV